MNPCKITLFDSVICTILQNYEHWKNIAQLSTSTEKISGRIDIAEQIFFSLRYEMEFLRWIC